MKVKTQLMDEVAMQRSIKRISHEIIEKNINLDETILIGIKTRGTPLAKRISTNLLSLENKKVPVEELDISLYRDDLTEIDEKPNLNSDGITVDVKGKIIIICDDVIYTGRTARAAIDAIMSHGRPKIIYLVALIDRGHREIPIRPDFVGKNVPTSSNEVVSVSVVEIDQKDEVKLLEK